MLSDENKIQDRDIPVNLGCRKLPWLFENLDVLVVWLSESAHTLQDSSIDQKIRRCDALDLTLQQKQERGNKELNIHY